MEDILYKQFLDPNNQYRGKPFWSWNGDLELDELIRQIHVMKEMGFGGFFMHSRTGLETEYLGEKWFELINACADEAERLGMEAWLYDEDRWPSGTAGGMVTENPKYRLKFIRLHIFPTSSFVWKDEYFAVFSCRLDGFSFYDCVRISPGELIKDDKDRSILAFSIEEMGKSSFYNGYTYVDTMNKEATERFLELTHEKYKHYCGDRLGRSIKGIFVDEPHRGPILDGFSLPNDQAEWLVPWTESLFSEFKAIFGYDIVDSLPALFLQEEGRKVSQVKWHYIELLQRLFIENFAKPVQEWCQKHNLILTGHILHEDTLTAQTAVSGSMMRYYPYLDYPGVDVLTEGNNNYWIVKQLSSVARQLGQKWLLSELYGCTGWQMTFENHKAVGNWQALFGINLRCHHLSWYTMKGEAKRDYPASILHQSTWWREYNFVETYFSRLAVILSKGKPKCDVLVLNPVESVWCQVYPGWSRTLQTHSPEVQQLEVKYQQLFHWLAGAQIDFDYGDEGMLPDLYRIEVTDSGPVLHVGEATYKTVIVHGMTTIRKTTVKILEEFIKLGGKVIFLGDLPKYLDALPDESTIQKLANKAIRLTEGQEQLISACFHGSERIVEVEDADTKELITDIFCQVREDDNRLYIVLMNMNREKSYHNVKVRFNRSGIVEEWNCQNGERKVVAQTHDKETEIITSFPVVGEKIYIIQQHSKVKEIFRPLKDLKTIQLANRFEFQLKEPNVCVLDFAKFKIEEGVWHPETEILKIDQFVRNYFGLEHRGGEMIQPWYAKKKQLENNLLGKVSLQFEFEIKDMPKRDLELVMEDPELFHIKCNGNVLDNTCNGWWIDRSMKRIKLPHSILTVGKNTIELEIEFHEQIGFEAIYIIGEFGIYFRENKPIISHLPEVLKIGNVTNQGLPFYSGIITYEVPLQINLKENERVYLQVPNFSGACIRISSTNLADPIIAWPPYEAELTSMIRNGEQIVHVDLILTRRNTFGPLHLPQRYSVAYGPNIFVTTGENFTDEYCLIPSGLLEPLKLQIRK